MTLRPERAVWPHPQRRTLLVGRGRAVLAAGVVEDGLLRSSGRSAARARDESRSVLIQVRRCLECARAAAAAPPRPPRTRRALDCPGDVGVAEVCRYPSVPVSVSTPARCQVATQAVAARLTAAIQPP